MKEIDFKLLAILKRYAECGIEQQVDYENSISTHLLPTPRLSKALRSQR